MGQEFDWNISKIASDCFSERSMPRIQSHNVTPWTRPPKVQLPYTVCQCVIYTCTFFCHYFTFLIIVWNSIVPLRSTTFVCFFFQWDAVKIRTRWTRGDKMRLTTKTCWESIVLSMFSLSSGMFPEKWTRKPELFGSLKKKKRLIPMPKQWKSFWKLVQCVTIFM